MPVSSLLLAAVERQQTATTESVTARSPSGISLTGTTTSRTADSVLPVSTMCSHRLRYTRGGSVGPDICGGLADTPGRFIDGIEQCTVGKIVVAGSDKLSVCSDIGRLGLAPQTSRATG